MAIYVSGSIAFDRIMTFPGNFKDHVLMDRLDKLNISFMVDDMIERRGGCAGNIAYGLALLGESPLLVSSVGKDFADYGRHLEAMGLSLEGVRVDPDRFTALCFITTDQSGNQLTGFYPGASASPSDYAFPRLGPEDLAIVSPGNMEDMDRLPKLYRERGVRFIFDPGQQLPVFTRESLERAVEGAFAYVCNDYELGMSCRTLGLKKEEELLDRVQWLVTTLGERGCRLRGRDGTDLSIAAVPCGQVADPTGAGDAHRAGLLLGLSHGLSMERAIRLGSVSSSYVLERQGTQEHSFSMEDFRARYEAAYGAWPL